MGALLCYPHGILLFLFLSPTLLPSHSFLWNFFFLFGQALDSSPRNSARRVFTSDACRAANKNSASVQKYCSSRHFWCKSCKGNSLKNEDTLIQLTQVFWPLWTPVPSYPLNHESYSRGQGEQIAWELRKPDCDSWLLQELPCCPLPNSFILCVEWCLLTDSPQYCPDPGLENGDGVTFILLGICQVNLYEKGVWRVESEQQKAIHSEGIHPARKSWTQVFTFGKIINWKWHVL